MEFRLLLLVAIFWQGCLGQTTVNVPIRCSMVGNGFACVPVMENVCKEQWNFGNPCTQANMAAQNTKFIHPNDNTKFLMCNENGKLFVVQCPRFEVYNQDCKQCIGDNSRLVGSCERPLAVQELTQNPCTKANILANRLFFPFPGNLSLFIHCDIWGKPWERYCPPGDTWNQWDTSCVNPLSMNPCTRLNADRSVLYKHPCDSTKFLQCVDVVAYEVMCPAGQSFDLLQQGCRLIGSFPGSDEPRMCGNAAFSFKIYGVTNSGGRADIYVAGVTDVGFATPLNTIASLNQAALAAFEASGGATGFNLPTDFRSALDSQFSGGQSTLSSGIDISGTSRAFDAAAAATSGAQSELSNFAANAAATLAAAAMAAGAASAQNSIGFGTGTGADFGAGAAVGAGVGTGAGSGTGAMSSGGAASGFSTGADFGAGAAVGAGVGTGAGSGTGAMSSGGAVSGFSTGADFGAGAAVGTGVGTGAGSGTGAMSSGGAASGFSTGDFGSLFQSNSGGGAMGAAAAAGGGGGGGQGAAMTVDEFSALRQSGSGTGTGTAGQGMGGQGGGMSGQSGGTSGQSMSGQFTSMSGQAVDMSNQGGSMSGQAGDMSGQAGQVGGQDMSMSGQSGGMSGQFSSMTGQVGDMGGQVGNMGSQSAGMSDRAGAMSVKRMSGQFMSMTGQAGDMIGNGGTGGQGSNMAGQTGNTGGQVGVLSGQGGSMSGQSGSMSGGGSPFEQSGFVRISTSSMGTQGGNMGGQTGSMGGQTGNMGGHGGSLVDHGFVFSQGGSSSSQTGSGVGHSSTVGQESGMAAHGGGMISQGQDGIVINQVGGKDAQGAVDGTTGGQGTFRTQSFSFKTGPQGQIQTSASGTDSNQALQTLIDRFQKTVRQGMNEAGATGMSTSARNSALMDVVSLMGQATGGTITSAVGGGSGSSGGSGFSGGSGGIGGSGSASGGMRATGAATHGAIRYVLTPADYVGYAYSAVRYSDPCNRDNIAAGQLYFKLKSDTHKFIQCDTNGYMHEMPCSSRGLDYFDPEVNTCVDGPVHVDNIINSVNNQFLI